jgi:hypothetical protein
LLRGRNSARVKKGNANSPTILDWTKRLDTKVLGIVYNGETVPWCGLFVATCWPRGEPAAIDHCPGESVGTWGANLRVERLSSGAVLVFEREGGGHVGFYA